jgi:repressor LexA
MGQHRKDLPDEVFEFVREHIVRRGYAPTYEEIKRALHISSRSNAKYHVHRLVEDGRIEHIPGVARGLRVPGVSPLGFPISVEARIAAGRPLLLADRLDEQIELTPALADPRKELYALRVQGDSMIDALVADGDVIVVERQNHVPRGKMAVVHLRERNEATLKYVYPEGDRVRLQPAHPTMPAFYVPSDDVEIQGRVVTIIRRLA